jgi:cytochrome c-type biogenesis protein CcmE
MSSEARKYLRFGTAISVIVLSLAYLAYTGVEENKSYYMTIGEMRSMDERVFSKRLRVAGNVVPGSIQRQGTRLDFRLVEQGHILPVSYRGTEAPPDTFVDNSQALVEGQLGRDGVFQAKHIQAKCASKYAPADSTALQEASAESYGANK